MSRGGEEANKHNIERQVAKRESNPVAHRRLIEFMESRWAITGQWEIFVNDLSKNSTGIGKWAIMLEIRVITKNLSAMPDINEMFDWHNFEWMTRKQGYYGKLLTKEFYYAYAAIMLNSFIGEMTRKKKKVMAIKSLPLEHVHVRGVRVGIFKTTIHHVLYGPACTVQTLTGLYKHGTAWSRARRE